jgi:hypothetical protein
MEIAEMMSKGQQTFKQGDVTKALKAAANAGMSVKRFEIDRDGKIIVIADGPLPLASPVNEWDDVK